MTEKGKKEGKKEVQKLDFNISGMEVTASFK